MITWKFIDKYKDGQDKDYRWGMVYENSLGLPSTLIAIGLNPSGKTKTQGEESKAGRTVKMLQNIAEKQGFGRLVIMNVTPIKELKASALKTKSEGISAACQKNIDNIVEEIKASQNMGVCEFLLCYGTEFRKLPESVKVEFARLNEFLKPDLCHCLGVCGSEEKGFFPCHPLARIKKEFRHATMNSKKVGEVLA